MQTIVPFTRDDEEVFIRTLIGLGNVRDRSNGRDLTFKIVTYFLPLLAIVNPIYIMVGEIGPHFMV